jgi:hypothetical protein
MYSMPTAVGMRLMYSLHYPFILNRFVYIQNQFPLLNVLRYPHVYTLRHFVIISSLPSLSQNKLKTLSKTAHGNCVMHKSIRSYNFVNNFLYYCASQTIWLWYFIVCVQVLAWTRGLICSLSTIIHTYVHLFVGEVKRGRQVVRNAEKIMHCFGRENGPIWNLRIFSEPLPPPMPTRPRLQAHRHIFRQSYATHTVKQTRIYLCSESK